jgi:peptidoglycan/LPS O-acetylase OafA/YrhL
MKRVKTLDFLRGIAVILVLFRHHTISPFLHKIGWIGVDLFFVLSGFLVSNLLFKEYVDTGKVNIRRFFIRRGLKIYPLFYFFILLTVATNLILSKLNIHKDNILLTEIVNEIFFLQNYLDGIWSHTWSLAVEEHFYILLAVYVFVIVKCKWISRTANIVCFIVCLLIVVFTLRWHYVALHPIEHQLGFTHLRIDSLFFGVLLSYLYVFQKESFKAVFAKRRFILFTFVAAILLSPSLILLNNDKFVLSYGLSMLYIGFGIVLSYAVLYDAEIDGIDNIVWNSFFNVICFIGFHSYSIYLFHIYVAKYFVSFFVKYFGSFISVEIKFILYFLFSILIGYLMAKLIEIPFLRFRDKLFPKPLVSNNSFLLK